MDRELPARVIRTRRIKMLLGVASIVVLFVFSVWAIRWVTERSVKRSRIRTAVAEIGSLDATVTASGIVIPAFEQAITSPVRTTVESVFVETGDHVTKDQALMSLDKEALLSSHQRISDELELQRTKKRQLSLQLERQRIDLQTSYDLKQLQVEYARAQYARDKRLHDIGGTTDEDLARSELSVEMAERELTQLAARIDNQQASLKADLSAVDLEIRISRNKLQEIARQLDLAQVRPTCEGIVTWIKDDIGASVAEGEELARVADLESFKIEAKISDVHADKVVVGGLVKIRTNDQYLDGRIQSVQPSVQEGVISFVVKPDDADHPSLRPNLRTDVLVVTAREDSVLRVPNGPFYNGVREQTVYVVEGNEAVAHTVDIGATNFDWVELRGDIRPGDIVIISDMSGYHRMDRVSIDEDS
jgi:HlyD family secretion protein